MDKDIVEGMLLWLRARQVMAIRMNEKEVYITIDQLIKDVETSFTQGKYPWDVLMEGFVNRASKVKEKKEE